MLEMRSTEEWGDVRYRDYTTSKKKADAFREIPKCQFTDSGHGVVSVVKEMKSRKLPVIRVMADYVNEHMPSGRGQVSAPKPEA